MTVARGIESREVEPLCECHGEPMYWQRQYGVHRRGGRKRTGGYWRCRVALREAAVRRQRRDYDPEKRWRRYIGQERPRSLDQQRERVAAELQRLEDE